MDTYGRHVLMDLWDCDVGRLDDEVFVHEMLDRGARISNSTPVFSRVVHFDPCGVTGFVVVEESHFSIHTWPESGYAAIDAYTCGHNCDPMKAVEVFRRGLGAKSIEIQEIVRGIKTQPSHCRVVTVEEQNGYSDNI